RFWFGAALRILRDRRSRMLENLILRQQLAVLKHNNPRPRLGHSISCFGYWCAGSGFNGRRRFFSSSRKLGGTGLGSNCIGPCSAKCENESAVAVESPNR